MPESLVSEDRAILSPVSKHTRQQLAKQIPETPSKGKLPNLPAEDRGDEESEPESAPSTDRSLASNFSPAPKEAANTLYPKSIDEEFVNSALIALLNAVTVHYSLRHEWLPTGNLSLPGLRRQHLRQEPTGILVAKMEKSERSWK